MSQTQALFHLPERIRGLVELASIRAGVISLVGLASLAGERS